MSPRQKQRRRLNVQPKPNRAIAFVGDGLADGRMDLRVLSEAIGGFATLTEKSSLLLYGEVYDHRVELAASPETGSVVIPIDIVSHAMQVVENDVKNIEDFLLSPGIQALANLCTLLGVGAIGTTACLFRMFKEKKGRAIDAAADVSLLSKLDVNIEASRFVRLYNNVDIRTSLRRTLRPLREDGIEEFQTRRDSVIVERVTKADLLAADAAEIEDIVEIEEKWLDVQKVALVRHLAWHFASDTLTFDARIDDEQHWMKVEAGERFGAGDRLQVVLKTTASRDRNGRLHVEHRILEVLDIRHQRRPTQDGLFSADS